MASEQTSAVVQRYLDALAADAPVIRDLLDRAVRRLRLLATTVLRGSYPRLTQPPLNLKADELLGPVVERLLKALREARPADARQFFALAAQHMRWELADMARRLDEQPGAVALPGDRVLAPESSASGLGPTARRILAAIDALPEAEREVVNLVRVQGLTHAEAAELLGVSAKTVQRRLHRGLLSVAEQLPDLRPAGGNPGAG
jgi:RNA polymerase sigma-70 factor (ECF subfamily)